MADKGMYPPGTPEQPSTPGVVVRAPPARARRGAAICACYRAGDLRHCGTARARCAPWLVRMHPRAGERGAPRERGWARQGPARRARGRALCAVRARGQTPQRLSESGGYFLNFSVEITDRRRERSSPGCLCRRATGCLSLTWTSSVATRSPSSTSRMRRTFSIRGPICCRT